MAIRAGAVFKQGPKLKVQYEHNPSMHGGICFALMVQWFRLMTATEADDDLSGAFDELFGDPSQTRMDALDEAFKLAGGRQMVYTSGLSVSKVDKATHHTYGGSYAKVLSGMGVHYGVDFEYLGWGTSAAQVGGFVSQPNHAYKVLYLSIKFAKGGGHAIGIATRDPQICFDPNLGEYVYDTADSTTFFQRLWAVYGGTNGGISNLYLYEMKVRESLRDFWERTTKA